MKINPFDVPDSKVAELLARSAEIASRRQPDWLLAFCESPIETLFMLGTWSRGVWTDRVDLVPPMTVDELAGCCAGAAKLACAPQVRVGEYRADFLFVGDRSGSEPRCFVAVECDGHEFHERSKEQATRDKARDRAFAELGITVMRFTGSEIWADAGGCADQVISFVENEYHASSDRMMARVIGEFGSVDAWRDAMYNASSRQ